MQLENRGLTLVELNEFNVPLLERAASELALPNLQALLTLPRAQLWTADRDDSGFLEPWAQWVSIHTGQPASQHLIEHLGDVPDLAFSQIWETLGRSGVTTGVWGVMNGARREAPGCRYFLPDPWTFSEHAHPATLTDLLALPRYLATHYLKISKRQVARLGMRFIRCLAQQIGWGTVVRNLAALLPEIMRHGPQHFLFIASFEYLSVRAMLRQEQAAGTDVRIVFLNSLAHLQHHYWTQGAVGITPQLAHGFRLVDKMIGLLMGAAGPGGALLVTNGLSQRNTNDEPPWILYRPIDPVEFLRAAGMIFEQVQPLMSYDAHVFFADAARADAAERALREARTGDRPLLWVQRTHPTKLFYRIDFSDVALPQQSVEINGRSLQFARYFEKIVQRTGRHDPNGVAFARGLALPDRLMNHELYDHIVRHATASQ
jgi:hypothetical protein